MTKYTELWNGPKNQIKTINGGKPIKYKKGFIEIRFESDDGLPLGKILSILGLIIVHRSLLQKDKTYYPQVYLHEYLYKFVCSSCIIYTVLLVIFSMIRCKH